MKRNILAAALLALSGCATAPDKIKATEVSASAYAAWNCQQLAAENAKISTSLDAMSATQRQAHTDDVVGVFLVGLPVGSMASGNRATREADIARIKGEKVAIYQTQKAKGCA